MKKEIPLDAKGHRKFGIRDKIAYAAGDLGCNMSFSLKSTVQTFWLVFMMLETGLLSALLATSVVSPLELSALAAYVHGRAGDNLSKEFSEYGVTPSDLPREMARVLSEIEK